MTIAGCLVTSSRGRMTLEPTPDGIHAWTDISVLGKELEAHRPVRGIFQLEEVFLDKWNGILSGRIPRELFFNGVGVQCFAIGSHCWMLSQA